MSFSRAAILSFTAILAVGVSGSPLLAQQMPCANEIMPLRQQIDKKDGLELEHHLVPPRSPSRSSLRGGHPRRADRGALDATRGVRPGVNRVAARGRGHFAPSGT